ncbi:AAA family ATPase [Frisingicoccus sp.]|uniref:AAA family ATPase n=1 Tax=Frisingicoccus sp. TaxID=1918627 RepID=UPI003AB65E14
MLKKLPVGVDGFEKIRTQDFYYVDKTMFISELLENWGEVNLFTRPRRFGKTLIMDMLKSFFEIGCNKALFDGLKIAQEQELCEQYMGKFPVISVTLKGVSGDSFLAAANAMRNVIGNEALRFEFLQNSQQLSIAEKEKYAQLTRISEGTKDKAIYDMSDAVLVESLKTLSQLLSKHYRKKVILLIDEYDVPLDKAFQGGYYEEMVSFIRNLFGNALKTNPNMYFAVITGCLRITKESIFTGLNNLKVNTITNPRFNEYFGFTDEEVDDLLSFYRLEAHKEEIKDWYDGYHFGKKQIPIRDAQMGLYCPWDVISYCDDLLADPAMPPKNYWANTSENALVKRFIYKADQTTKDEIEQLINGGIVSKRIKQELTYNELDSSIENLWSILFSTGYLTQRGNIYGDDLELIIPNKEIKMLFIRLAEEWFKDRSRADLSRIEKFCAAFPEGNVNLIEEMLHDYLWDSISVRDTAVRKNMKENFYHGMVLGLLQSRGDWLIKSNAELGEGYSDIVIYTPDRVGMIIELKYADDGNLERGCLKALEQIEDRKYAVGLEHKRLKKVLRYGMAFYEKECKVVLAE